MANTLLYSHLSYSLQSLIPFAFLLIDNSHHTQHFTCLRGQIYKNQKPVKMMYTCVKFSRTKSFHKANKGKFYRTKTYSVGTTLGMIQCCSSLVFTKRYVKSVKKDKVEIERKQKWAQTAHYIMTDPSNHLQF